MGICAAKSVMEGENDLLPDAKHVKAKTMAEARTDGRRVRSGVHDEEKKYSEKRNTKQIDEDQLQAELDKLNTLEEEKPQVDQEERKRRIETCQQILDKFPQIKVACIDYANISEDDEVLPPFWFYDGETNRYINALTGKKLSRPPDWSKAVYLEKYCDGLLVGFEEVPSKSRPGKKVYQMLLDQRARLPKKPAIEKLSVMRGLPPGWKRVPSRSRKGKWVFLNRVSLVRASKDVLVLIASAMDYDCDIPDSDEEWSMASDADEKR